ncbi:MAG: cysteine desulfurase / selenocysteine lyase [Phycisphaerales bacterium]|jgi:cysteine desulfurase/selenocysteine lyase|nr:cysteine desulfurase / selenocysteine lyase [Phycisphaerales bacterium]
MARLSNEKYDLHLPPQVIPSSKPQAPFDPLKVRQDFPILQTKHNGRPLVYLDNGATTQKPRVVIDAIRKYYEEENANIHRGVYHLSQLATNLYEEARAKIRKFINAQHDREIIYTRGATEGINLVAQSYGRSTLTAGDEVVVSAMEHHSNIVPWQMICEQTGAKLRVIPMNERGELLVEEFAKILAGGRVKIVSIVHLSNSLGTINDIKLLAKMAHDAGAVIVVDGAQWVAHYPTDVRDLDVDFYAFSGHKLFGPTGIGVLYGKVKMLEAMPPHQGGGDMIKSVTFEKTEYADLPNKFEAGTPHIAGAVGLGAAIDYVTSIGLTRTAPHEQELLAYATQRLAEVPGLRIIGNAKNKASVISFVMENPPIASHDIGVILDQHNIAIRTGHHCCQPVMDRLGISSTARISLAMYNTRGDIDAAVEVLKQAGTTTQARPEAKGQIDYPQASAATPGAAAEELVEVFDFLGDDPNAKSLFVMDDLGGKLPNLFDLLKKVTTRVEGCMSEVYFIGRRSPKNPQVLEFVADADAAIVRGEIAMLEKLFSGQKANEILAFDVEAFFRRIGLEQFLTSQRRNGLAGMVRRIHLLAEQVAGAPDGT